MSDEILNKLRYRSESDDLDFKQAQYHFIGGNDTTKSEVLKDILAMANAWREGTGYIVLGFKDQRPHPAEVTGITEQIDDAQLQQFVNSKVKPKLTFRYEEHLYEGKTVGLISVPKQKRPFYIGNAYGKLKSNVVYVRRGSSTDEAEPTEVIAMASDDASHVEIKVDLLVQTPDNADLPDMFAHDYLHLTELFPDYEKPRTRSSSFDIGISSIMHDNRSFLREMGEYIRISRALILVQFVLRNHSQTQLTNVKLEIMVDPLDSQEVEMQEGDKLPKKPRSQWSPLHQEFQSTLLQRESMLQVDDSGIMPLCSVRFGALLPGEQGRSTDSLALIPRGPGKVRLRFRILAAELTAPIESERVLETAGEILSVDFDGFQKFMKAQTRPELAS
ncbi:AlbA family DNA-binding domain-containing protein [Janthinobacterium sp. B9-8]|uniref:AlbA family DNA-binding domain-containing protein n=1 Tax=Janthinobacterium sp. B9-8 TaxID=1236179 RepID=UPI00061D3C8C|nr:ATP-binding protein [Janthinobacterium sp. B9-8]AMC36617.1 transcriptional regulator [Janthinobacterium sp. B9-8]